jgi:hypothetical protein
MTARTLILLGLGLWVSAASALTTLELKALQGSVHEMCLLPDRSGDYLKVEGEAKAGLPVAVKVIKGDISGKISYDTWKGIPITLDKYKTDPRQCALEMMKLLLPSFKSESGAKVSQESYSEVLVARITDISRAAKNAKSLQLEIEQGKIQQPGPYNRINDLNNSLSDLWLKIAGYGLGTDPFVDNIFFSSSGFSKAQLPPDFGIPEVKQSIGIPRLFRQYLATKADGEANRKQKLLEKALAEYANPAIYPFRDFYERAYSDYRSGENIGTAQFRTDVDFIGKWLVQLISSLNSAQAIIES